MFWVEKIGREKSKGKGKRQEVGRKCVRIVGEEMMACIFDQR